MGGDEGGQGRGWRRRGNDGACTDVPRDASDGRVSGLVSLFQQKSISKTDRITLNFSKVIS